MFLKIYNSERSTYIPTIEEKPADFSEILTSEVLSQTIYAKKHLAVFLVIQYVYSGVRIVNLFTVLTRF